MSRFGEEADTFLSRRAVALRLSMEEISRRAPCDNCYWMVSQLKLKVEELEKNQDNLEENLQQLSACKVQAEIALTKCLMESKEDSLKSPSSHDEWHMPHHDEDFFSSPTFFGSRMYNSFREDNDGGLKSVNLAVHEELLRLRQESRRKEERIRQLEGCNSQLSNQFDNLADNYDTVVQRLQQTQSQLYLTQSDNSELLGINEDLKAMLRNREILAQKLQDELAGRKVEKPSVDTSVIVNKGKEKRQARERGALQPCSKKSSDKHLIQLGEKKPPAVLVDKQVKGSPGDSGSEATLHEILDSQSPTSSPVPKSISVRASPAVPLATLAKKEKNAPKPTLEGSSGGTDSVSEDLEEFDWEVFNQGTYKTEICNKWVETGKCPYKDRCQFAHGVHELRPVLRHPRYKTELCRMVASGSKCPYGHRCHFRHSLTPEEFASL